MKKDSYFFYDNHEFEWDRVLNDEERKKIGDTWFRTDTLDAWRHQRMRAPLQAIIEADKEASWLTIGDGRYGTDANFLIRNGAKKVHASDLFDRLLKIGHEKGFIQDYSAQNAEDLTFEDNSFDYIYCKESFHHLPRPYAALYEMFRVAKKAVILTEPRDTTIEKSVMPQIRDLAKRILGKEIKPSHNFEPVGNYVYTISEREIEKFMLGMHYTEVAFIGCNDAYQPGVEFIPTDSLDPEHIKTRDKLFASIEKQDSLCRRRLRSTGILTAAMFKSKLSDELALNLKTHGWTVKTLPTNPYLKKS